MRFFSSLGLFFSPVPRSFGYFEPNSNTILNGQYSCACYFFSFFKWVEPDQCLSMVKLIVTMFLAKSLPAGSLLPSWRVQEAEVETPIVRLPLLAVWSLAQVHAGRPQPPPHQLCFTNCALVPHPCSGKGSWLGSPPTYTSAPAPQLPENGTSWWIMGRASQFI